VPTFIVGPQVVDAQYRNYATQTVLCALTLNESSHFQAVLAAQIAAEHHARLILQHIIRPQQRAAELAHQTVSEIEHQLLSLVPESLRETVETQAIVVPGDPAEELLFQSRAQQADLIVLGAHAATALAAITRHGVVHQVLAHSQCPALALSPVLLAASRAQAQREHAPEVNLSGVF
jgi:nucleotide-binding universal stress UspA family protein